MALHMTTVTPFGIPVHFPAQPHKQPLDPGLRRTLGLDQDKEVTTITFAVPKVTLTERLRRKERVTKGTSPINPNTYCDYWGDESCYSAVDDDIHDTSWDNIPAGHEKTAAPRDDRELRNRSRKIVTAGKRKPKEVEWLWRPYPHEPLVNVTIMCCDTHDVKYIYHDSHGKHGRKAEYKNKHATRMTAPQAVYDVAHTFEEGVQLYHMFKR